MRYLLILMLGLGSNLSFGQFVADFENVDLPPDTFQNNFGSAMGFWSGDIFFRNCYNADFDSWTKWALSTKTDTITPGFNNPYSAFAGSGKASDTYAVASAFEPVTFKLVELSEGKTIYGIYITNNTYAALSMRDGDSFAKKFGGETGNDPDFFKLTIRKWLAGERSQDSVDFFLADYRFEDNSLDYIIKDWTYVDLQDLGGVDSLEFTLTSSDIGVFGMNTPAFFCIDDVLVEIQSGTEESLDKMNLEIYPNPAEDYIYIRGLATSGMNAKIYDQSGRLVKEVTNGVPQIKLDGLPPGTYFLKIEGVSTHQFIKQ